MQSFPLPAMNQPIRQCQPSSQRTSPSTKFLPPSPSVAANWSSLQPPFSSSSSASSKFHPKPPNLPVAQSPGNHRPSPGIFDTQLSMRRDHLGSRQVPGSFNYAHDFTIQNPTMVHTQNVYHIDPLDNLAGHTIPGAEFDSSARDPPPQCHPGTRKDILRLIQTWLYDPTKSTRLLWLNGSAGVGKSAIIQTVAELAPPHTLGATLFFSRDSGRDRINRVVTTISYQLATRSALYRAYVADILAADSKLLEKSLREQFRHLISIPFGERRLCDKLFLSVLLDGLDECRESSTQSELVQLIATFVEQYPISSLIWIVASRPEPHLQRAFDKFQPLHWRISVPVDSSEAQLDVEHFLRYSLDETRRDFPNSFPPWFRWPSESDIVELAHAASGLFIFASVVVNYVRDEDIGDPVSQLTNVLSLLSLSGDSDVMPDPFTVLDKLYARILSDIPKSTLPTSMRILGHLLIESEWDQARIAKIGFTTSVSIPSGRRCLLFKANLLGLRQHAMYGALQKLHSVVRVPSQGEASYQDIRLLHASFGDYLRDPRRSQRFAVDLDGAWVDAWSCRLRVQKQAMAAGHAWPQLHLITLSWSPEPYALSGPAQLSRPISYSSFNPHVPLLEPITGPVPPNFKLQSRLYLDSQARWDEDTPRCPLWHPRANSTLNLTGDAVLSDVTQLLADFDFAGMWTLCYGRTFLAWLCEAGRSSGEVQTIFDIECTTLGGLDINRILLDKVGGRLDVYPGSGQTARSIVHYSDTSPHSDHSCPESLRPMKVMVREFDLLQRTSPKLPVLKLGASKQRKCIIFKHDLRTLEADGVRYFVVPYS